MRINMQFITTYSRIKFTPLTPVKEDIRIEDIAHALSMMTRANGHFPEFFSVGQHCINCCNEALVRGYTQKTALACLLHDGSEAYLSDITRPVKQNLIRYKEIEQVLENMIYEKYIGSLTKEEYRKIKEVDDAMLYYEFIHYMQEKVFDSRPHISSEPVFVQQPFKEVEAQYLKLFNSLYMA